MYTVTALHIISVALVSLVLPQETPTDLSALPQTTNDIDPTGTPICTQEQQNAFLSMLPNAAVCVASLETISSPPLDHPHLLNIAFDNLCTRDCGGAFVEFQESVCEDELAAESIRLFCTHSNGTPAVGEYCRLPLLTLSTPYS